MKEGCFALTKNGPTCAHENGPTTSPEIYSGGTLCPSTATLHGRRGEKEFKESAEPPGAIGSSTWQIARLHQAIAEPRRKDGERDRSEHVGTMAGSMGEPRMCATVHLVGAVGCARQ
jgi:hypothetical protein